MEWAEGKLDCAKINSLGGAPLILHNTAATDLGNAFFYLNSKRVTPTQGQDGTFSVDMKKGDILTISADNLDEQMQTAIDKVPVSLPSYTEQMYDLSGRRYNKTAGHYGIHVVNGQKKLLR